MLDLGGGKFDAGLTVGFGVVGADAAVSAIEALGSAFQSTVESAASVELLKKSMASLAAVELVDRGRFTDIEAASSLAAQYADSFYASQEKMARLSPYSLDEVSGAMKTASAYGFLATQVEDVAKARELDLLTAQRVSQAMLDTVAGTGKEGRVVGELVEIVGRANVSGKYLQEDANMLLDRGVRFYDILADRLGKTSAEIKKMQGEGRLTAQIVNAELIPALEKMYGGAAAGAGDTISGRLSTFGDALKKQQQVLFEPAINALSDALGEVNDALIAPDAIANMKAFGDTLGDVTEHVIDLSTVAVDGFTTVADVTTTMVVPAVATLGTAAGVAGVKFLVTGGAANIMAAGMANAASTAWALQAAIRGVTLQAGLLAAIPLTVGAFVFADQNITNQVNDRTDALYNQTAGAQKAAQAMKLYGSLSTETRNALAGTYDQMTATNEQAKRLFNQDLQDAARSGLFQSHEEAARITVKNALIRSQPVEQLADALYREAIASGNAADAALAKAAADQAATDAATARQAIVEDALKTQQKMIDNEVSFQWELWNLEVERYQKQQTARQTYDDALASAQQAYNDAEAAAAQAHADRMTDIRQSLYLELVDSAVGYNQEVADLRTDYNQKGLDEIDRYNQEVADLRTDFNNALVDAQETARLDALTALDALAGTDANFLQDSEKRLEEWNKKRELLHKQGASCKVDEERKAYEQAEQEAAKHYLEQERQQRQSLGRQLIDFTVSQALKNDVSADALGQMLTGISEATGLYDSTSAALMGNTFSGIQQWAQSGGAGMGGVLANIQALPAAAAQARLEQDRLTDSMVNNAVSSYLATGNVEAYQQQLQQIPASVATQMGVSVSDQGGHDLLTQHQQLLTDIQTAQSQHNDAMSELEKQHNQDAEQARLDYGKAIGKALFQKGLSQQEVSAFMTNQMPAIVSEVERINQQFDANIRAGMAPEVAAAQYAYALDASEYAKITGQTGGEATDSLLTKLQEIDTATQTHTQSMADAWKVYQDTLTIDIPQWYEDSKTQIVTKHGQQVADLQAQLNLLEESEREALQQIAVDQGQYLFRNQLDLQTELRKLVRSGAEGDTFYSRYAQLTAQAGEVIELSTNFRNSQNSGIVQGQYIPPTVKPTIVVNVELSEKSLNQHIADVSYQTIEGDFVESSKNRGLTRR
jgi:tape measure domain-containing protein